ncbi:Xanthine dehydrogenase 1 [Hibiscus syriacus]|uniref:Xanthine dehydrogenase 1 n=1 Tax=Hibiscus syriacus TaxID=106335 RepID=A0A6A2YUB3_HIBSY|nr:Xanthine dehydrogenase 1 [Hibiscus syriacus]
MVPSLTIKDVLELKEKFPTTKLIVGNTEVGVEMRLKRIPYQVLISVAHVPELNVLNVKDDEIEIENFFLGYRKVDLNCNEILLSIFLPCTRPFVYVKEFNQAHRRDDDIAIVNARMRVCLEEKCEHWIVSDASVAYGGVAPLSLSAIKKKEFLIGKEWSMNVLQGALNVLRADIVLKEDAPGGMVEFRRSLTLSFFFKFFLWVSHQIEGKKSIKESVPLSHLSAIKPFHRPPLVASKDYKIRKHGTSVNSPEVHLSSRLQVTGEAKYNDDTPMPSNALHAALVLSKKPHARILSINDSGAKSSHGFSGIFFGKDIPGSNKIGPIVLDEELFASEFVTCVGQVIGIVVTDTHENAKLAAGKVHVEYEELPAILLIEDANGAKNLHPNSQRIGGAFGGKETRSAFIAAAAVVPSYLMNRPVKLKLNRDTDMITTGQRHSFLRKYKVGFTTRGKVLALDLEIYNSAGNSLDQSPTILERAMFHSDNVYEIPNVRISGNVWKELKVSCEFLKVREEVDEFNCHNRWKKRGISMIPSKYGISFTTKFFNQLHMVASRWGKVYTQKLLKLQHLPSISLSARSLYQIQVDKVPNAAPTEASVSSDMYAAATLDACEQIKARMEPIASQRNYTSFAELLTACYLERIDLSAHGFYITPDIGFDWSNSKGTPFSYYTYGATFAEVEIDTLTGDFHTRAANVFMDLGYSLNPAIDVGQVEGAFIQGLGWVALEELKWGDASLKWIQPGCLYTCGPGTYKIPSLNDIPFKFNVSLLKGHPNVKVIHSSKAVGEPPFFMASSVFFAIKDAILAARAETGHTGWFPLDNPAIPERIRMVCLDEFTAPFVSSDFHPKLSV